MRWPSTSIVFFERGCSLMMCSFGDRVRVFAACRAPGFDATRPQIDARGMLRKPALDRLDLMQTGCWIPRMTSVDAASFSISDLRQRPEFFNVVADRIWRAWWKDSGHPLEYITGRLGENLDARPIPIALGAHDGPAFLGPSSVIASELEERPHYTPWVAAVWVEPQYRSRGIGANDT